MLTFHGLVLSVVETVLSRTSCSMSDLRVRRQNQVLFKETNEKRVNHRRGLVTNLTVVQNRRGRRPEEMSLKPKSWHLADQADNRGKDGVTLNWARIRNRGNLLRKREENYKPIR